jgi:hypothetical protein
MSLSSDTLKLLGCVTTAEELAAAIAENAATRVSSEEWEHYYRQSLQAQKTAKERFREYKANSAVPQQVSGNQELTADGAGMSTALGAETNEPEAELQLELAELFSENLYSAKPATVLFGRKRSSFSM